MSQPTELRISPVLSAEEADSLAGSFLDESHIVHFVDSDTDVFCADTGALVARFRKNILPHDLCRRAYPHFRLAAGTTSNRGIAAGVDPIDPGAPGVGNSGTRVNRIKKDGTVSKTSHAAGVVRSGIVGYFDRNPRFPYCRTTAFSMNHESNWLECLPYVRAVDAAFRDLAPDRHSAQMAMVKSTSPDFVISGTAFTTVTVNRNWQTAVHQDAGDYRPGFGVLSAFTSPTFSGCHFVIPRYGVGFDLRTADLLVADVHEWHGNTPIRPSGVYERISCVFYYREKMINCGRADQELARAKRVRSKQLEPSLP